MSAVPGRFHCSLNDRPYMLDMNAVAEGQFTRRAIPVLRQQVDQGEAFGEATLSAEELWRRSQDDWSHGAGQTHLDRDDSDNRRFRTSKGIDVWTRWQMGLLPTTEQRRASVNSSLALQTAGDYLYLVDGAAMVHTTDLSAFTPVTGMFNAPFDVASDGYNIWTAHGGAGVYVTTRGSGTSALYNSCPALVLAYVKGRLMVGAGQTLYNPTSTTPATELFIQPNTDFSWVGFAEGPTAIYAAGYSGDKSLIYRTTVKADATGLDVPVVAGELPDGEIVRSIYGYAGFLLVGSDLGVRFCAIDASGNLTIGALIRTSSAVHCFEGQDKFVWFGWSNYDGTSTGLGRLDLSAFTNTALTPAYASDLMVTGQGTVSGVVTFRNKRVLAVDGLGFYEQSANLVASGTLDTGLISYGLPDLKTAIALDVKVDEVVDTNKAYLAVDGGAFALVGTRDGATVEPFTVGELPGESFEVRLELVNDDAPLTDGPILTRYTLRSYPRPSQGEVFTVPLLLDHVVKDVGGMDYAMNPESELALLVALRESKQLVTFAYGGQSLRVLVDDANFTLTDVMNGKWGGIALVKLKALSE